MSGLLAFLGLGGGAESAESQGQASDASGSMAVEVKEELHDSPQVEILADDADVLHQFEEDVYLVVHEDGQTCWYRESMIDEDIVDEWTAYLSKRRRVERAQNEIAESKKDSLSEDHAYGYYRDTAPYNKALLKDGYPTLSKYPLRAYMNDYHVPREVGVVLAVTLNNREGIAAGLDEPPVRSFSHRIRKNEKLGVRIRKNENP